MATEAGVWGWNAVTDEEADRAYDEWKDDDEPEYEFDDDLPEDDR